MVLLKVNCVDGSVGVVRVVRALNKLHCSKRGCDAMHARYRLDRREKITVMSPLCCPVERSVDHCDCGSIVDALSGYQSD